MAIKRYYANADNTITNAYKEDFNIRGTGSNMGKADILEVFSLYAQRDSGSAEIARTLIQFPIANISSDRTSGDIPASGSVSYYLNLYNAEHTRTLPRNFTLSVSAIKNSWEEGDGLDMENYTDLTYNLSGSNWIRRAGATSWTTEGGDWHTDASSSFDQVFSEGYENLEIDITTLVEQWINTGGNVLGSKDNNGVIIRLSSSLEASSSSNLTGSNRSYYTKKFFARSSEFFFDRPHIEARWDSTRRDNRGNFYLSSSIAPATENLNSLFLYNYIRGGLRDIAGDSTQLPVLNLYYSSGSVPEGTARYFRDSSDTAVNYLSASRVSQGVYKVEFSATSSAITDTYSNLVDVWTYSGSQVHTGSSFTPNKHDFSDINPNGSYVISMPGLKESYARGTTERFRLYVRSKNWSPNIYTKAVSTPETLLIETASYQIVRLSDHRIVVPFGTGSDNHTVLSYDKAGNYFDLDVNLLESGYSYGVKFSFYEDSVSSYREQDPVFKFRVDGNPHVQVEVSYNSGEESSDGGTSYTTSFRRVNP
jgi:hypothetical protein